MYKQLTGYVSICVGLGCMNLNIFDSCVVAADQENSEIVYASPSTNMNGVNRYAIYATAYKAIRQDPSLQRILY